MDFTGFKEVLPNSVYAIVSADRGLGQSSRPKLTLRMQHDYSTMGFPAGQPYKGTDEQKQILRNQYERKVQFMREHKVPVSFLPCRQLQTMN